VHRVPNLSEIEHQGWINLGRGHEDDESCTGGGPPEGFQSIGRCSSSDGEGHLDALAYSKLCKSSSSSSSSGVGN